MNPPLPAKATVEEALAWAVIIAGFVLLLCVVTPLIEWWIARR